MDEERLFHPACKANGCPLAATVVTHWWERLKKRDPREPRWGVCEYHSLALGHEWTATTRIIQRNIKIIRLYQAMQALSDDSVKPLPGETVQQWLARYDETLKRLIVPDSAPPVPTAGDGFQAVMQAIGQGNPDG